MKARRTGDKGYICVIVFNTMDRLLHFLSLPVAVGFSFLNRHEAALTRPF